MDLKSFAEVYWSMQEGKVNPGLQAYLDKKKGKKENGDDDKKENGDDKENGNGKESKGSKPDFLDLDKDGNKKEPMKKAAKEKKMKEEAVIEHHQKDADGNVVPHEEEAAGTPSSIEEKTVLEQLSEDGREIDAFEAVISYLLDEGLAENWEHAEKIMTTLKAELVEEVYQNQLNELNKQERMETAKRGAMGVGKRHSKKAHGKGESFTKTGNVGRRNMMRFDKTYGGDGSRKLNKFGSDYQDDYRSKDGLRAEKSDHAQKQRRSEHEARRGVKTKGK